MSNKVKALSEVVRSIPDKGAEIALGGFAITRCPVAFVNELIRQKKSDLTIYQIIGGIDTDILVGSGLVKNLTYGGGALDRFGRLERCNEAVEKKTIAAKEYSGLSLSLRFLAGAMGVPFIPSKTLLGTEILARLTETDKGVTIQKSPFDQQDCVYYSALQPEYSVICAQYADEKGNVMIEGPIWDVEMAKAGKKLIVLAEKIVSTEYIKRFPEKVVVPSIYTYAVVEEPYAAFPSANYKCYDYDRETLALYAKINRTQADFDTFLKEYVLGTKDHKEFIEKLGGMKKLQKIQADPVFGYAKGGAGNGK